MNEEGAERRTREADPSAGGCMLCGAPVSPKFQFETAAVAYCDACQFGQLDPLPSESELAALYGSKQYFESDDCSGYADYEANQEQFRRTFRLKLRRLLGHGPVRDLLEIGCGPGYFLLEAREAGIDDVVGVDLNPWAIEEARKQQLTGYVGSIDAIDSSRRFDAIAMLDVLEHIRNPAAFLAELRVHLRPGGRLLIMTPNIRSILARFSGQRWVSFKIPEHLYYYSPRSIRRLLEGNGFEVLTVKATGQYVTVAFLLDRLERLLPRLVGAVSPMTNLMMIDQRVVLVSNGSIDVVARLR
jgi:SAM-dependent methyltransferase